jgi:hypothetical protein
MTKCIRDVVERGFSSLAGLETHHFGFVDRIEKAKGNNKWTKQISTVQHFICRLPLYSVNFRAGTETKLRDPKQSVFMVARSKILLVLYS